MANIKIKSYNETLGDLARKIKALVSINDLHDGSVLLTLLEAIASNDFENSVSILNTLELLNIDTISNSDLDAYASNLGLSRFVAHKSSGFITIKDSAITKRSTTLYSIKPAPIAGTKTLYVNNASGWSTNGYLYIGRNTKNYEGPIAYSNIINNNTFYTIELTSSLKNDHLISEEVIDSQNTSNKLISAGTRVKIPSNNLSPEIGYRMLRDAVIAAGEDRIDNVFVVAEIAGSSSNAGINTITNFDNPPFSTATVFNSISFTNGSDIESDIQFRDRIKFYSSTLARGTKAAILASIEGVSDSDEGKQVASAVITEPVKIGDPSIIYVDDGSGFEPSFTGQSVDKLLNSANGTEEFLQLTNFPLPRPQVINVAEAPYELTSGMQLRVLIDGIEESIEFISSDFNSISSAQLSEVMIAINDKAISFRCRLTNNSSNLLLYPIKHDVETIQIVDSEVSNANGILKFPVNEFSYIKLYNGSKLLKEKQKSASLSTIDFASWDINFSGNLIISVDETPAQDQTFDTSDFGGASFSSLTIDNYVEVFNKKFAGITATATTTNKMIITSNKSGIESSLKILGGSFFDKMFSGQVVSSVGQDSDFILNRQNGNIQILTKINKNDTVSAGLEDTKGNIVSNEASGSGTFSLSTDNNGRKSEVIIITDASEVVNRSVNLPVNSTLVITSNSNVMRIMASISSAFKEVQPNDYIYITNRGDSDLTGTGLWIDNSSCGLYKVIAKGQHLTEGVDTYLEVLNDNIVSGGPYIVKDSKDIQCFYSDKYPQIWKGVFLSTPAAATIQDIVDSVNDNIKCVIASIYKTNYVKITSSTENNGSICIPICVGNAINIFPTAGNLEIGNQSHIASKIPEKDIVSYFKMKGNASTFLNRNVFSDASGFLTSNYSVAPFVGESLEDTINEIGFNSDYNDLINVISGNNKSQVRAIKKIHSDQLIETRFENPATVIDYIQNDNYQVVKPLSISAQDNMVVILDNDSVAKTIDLSFSRTGRINSGSQGVTFIPTATEFSANDADNDATVDFGTLSVWGKLDTQTKTNFEDYCLWFAARNWYASGGINGTDGAFLIRSNQFGPTGELITFKMAYPVSQNAESTISHSSSTLKNSVVYTFGSEVNEAINLTAGDTATITEIDAINKLFKIKIISSSIDLSSVSVGQILSIRQNSGFSLNNCGTFKIKDVDIVNKEITIFNDVAVETVVGNPSAKTIDCIDALTLDGSYFTLFTPTQSVKFWFNMTGTTIEPNFGTTDLSYEIDDITPAMTAIQVATQLVNHINNTSLFTSNNLGGASFQITVSCISNGVVNSGDAGTTGFIVLQTVAGINNTFETINIPSSFSIFSLKDTDVETICNKINTSTIVNAVSIRSGNINTSTYEETDANVAHKFFDIFGNNKTFVNLYDSENWVLSFNNINPNFIMKKAFELSAAAYALNPSSPIYKLDTAKNVGGITLGEHFKLIPVTLSNLKHQLSHKALSQLDIISDINFANSNKNIQIKSELLGSQGAIEVVGGSANSITYSIIGDSQLENTVIDNYLMFKIPAFPESLNVNDYVKLKNTTGVKRLNRLSINDSIDVAKITDEIFEYRYNNKNISFTKNVEIKIEDVSLLYVRPSNIVWRWTHSDSGSYVEIQDISNGVVSFQPHHYNSNGLILDGGTNIELVVKDFGGISSKQLFTVEMSGQPSQGDYIYFTNTSGSTTAIWFDIDGNGSAPTSVNFTSAINKIKISVLSLDTANQITSKIISSSTTPLTGLFSLSLVSGASLSDVKEGDLLNVFGSFTGWDNGNKSLVAGDGKVSGFPVINVNSSEKYFDIINPYGLAMSFTKINLGNVSITPTPIIKLNVMHTVGTKYSIESLGFNDMFKLSFKSGTNPGFKDCGVAVDDIVKLSGNTFKSYNNGEFKVLGLTNEYIIFENKSAKEELNTIVNLNDSDVPVNWIASSSIVSGVPGSFENVNVGDWIKKTTDNDSYYRQVVGYNNGTGFSDTTQITIGSPYSGTTATAVGESFDQVNNVNKGVVLKNIDDITFYEGDSVRVSDKLFVSTNTDANWFSTTNSGLFEIQEIGTNSTDYRPFIRITNKVGLAEVNRKINVSGTEFYIIEGEGNKFTSVREISNICIDSFDPEKRIVYLKSGDRNYKWNQSNGSKIESIGKISFNSDIISGVDGYQYYTGLLRRVQRIIDGYEPDEVTYPGMKGVGSLVEILPSLKKKIKIVVNVTTRDGVNLSEISNEIKSTIINYVNTLKVGKDVIISDIIVRVKAIDGVEAVTLVVPSPSTERIYIGDDEKAYITSGDISIA